MGKSRARIKKFIFFFVTSLVTLLATSAGAKPTLPFNLGAALQSFRFPPFQQYIEKRQSDTAKNFSGRRIDSNSLRMVYFHDLTIAVVELGAEKLLIGCELIEVFSDPERELVLKKLERVNRPLEIGFKDMIKLMYQCELIENQMEEANAVGAVAQEEKPQSDQAVQESRSNLFANSFESITLLSGIIPGTKWCGTGDIATTYHDLGTEALVDRCCRTHDLCPSKVRAYQNRYNLENNSLYTKSHCTCDDMLYSCLKHSNSSAGNVLGQIYFNLVQLMVAGSVH